MQWEVGRGGEEGGSKVTFPFVFPRCLEAEESKISARFVGREEYNILGENLQREILTKVKR